MAYEDVVQNFIRSSFANYGTKTAASKIELNPTN